MIIITPSTLQMFILFLRLNIIQLFNLEDLHLHEEDAQRATVLRCELNLKIGQFVQCIKIKPKQEALIF